MMAMPSRRNWRISSNSFSVSREESAVVGSSMTRILELACSARAISTCCCSAIDRLPTGVVGVKVAPSRSSTSAQLSRMALRLTRPRLAISEPRKMFSATVRFGARLSS